jgi:hypothetical protein
MRMFFILAAATVLTLSASVAPQSRDRAEITCVVELRAPTYWHTLWHANRSGSLSVTASVGQDGKPSIGVSGGDAELRSMVKAQFETWEFDGSCKGRELKYEVEFRLQGKPSDLLISTTQYRPPNQFIVTANPGILSVNP